MYIKFFFYKLVNSNIEMQMSLCKIPSVNDDFSTIDSQPVFKNFPKKQSVLNKVSRNQRCPTSHRLQLFGVVNKLNLNASVLNWWPCFCLLEVDI